MKQKLKDKLIKHLGGYTDDMVQECVNKILQDTPVHKPMGVLDEPICAMDVVQLKSVLHVPVEDMKRNELWDYDPKERLKQGIYREIMKNDEIYSFHQRDNPDGSYDLMMCVKVLKGER